MENIVDLLEYIEKTTNTVYEAIARLEDNITTARIRISQSGSEREKARYQLQERLLQAVLKLAQKPI
jgi:hypothetical protein